MLKNVVIVTESFTVGGGASEVAIKTVKLLASLNLYNIWLVASGNLPRENERIENVQYRVLPASRQSSNKNLIQGFFHKLYSFQVKKEMSLILKNFSKADTVVHVHNWPLFSYSLYSALIEWDGAFCTTMHDYYAVCPSTNFFNYKKGKICNCRPGSIKCLFTMCDRRSSFYKLNQDVRFIFQNQVFHLFQKMENLIFVSDFSRKIMEPFFVHKRKVATINNPISFKDCESTDRNDKYLFVGRLSKEKGAELFCRAISELGLRGVVAGDGEEMKELKNKYPDIEFLGWCNRNVVQRLYQESRALIFPTLLYETAGLAVLEALAYKTPCIIPDKAAASQYVAHLETAVLFESGNVESLKNAILQMENEKLRAYLEKNIGASFDKSLFSDSTYINAILKYYESLLC